MGESGPSRAIKFLHLNSPSRAIKYLYAPAPQPPTVWALKPPSWALVYIKPPMHL
jgi:hypothetical protein